MTLAIKLGNGKELELLSTAYGGPFKEFELPARLLKEDSCVREFIAHGYSGTVHGCTMYENPGELEKISKQYLDLCAKYGFRRFVLHGLVVRGKAEVSDNEEFRLREATRRTIGTIAAYARALEIRCYLENGGYRGWQSNPFYEMSPKPAEHIDLARSTGTGILLDMGHAALSAYNFSENLDSFIAPYWNEDCPPAIIHWSDNNLSGDDHLGVGSGKADMQVYGRVLEKFPDACMTVETFPEGIQKTLLWLCERQPHAFTPADISVLCRSMGWDS